ncbi:hypothetical protein NLG97_g4251 [Lecanicillium saksenae]|uniref:Uncharacterized protein n=1 Tax=Lecanicillium saksenae TaxID=468837 RepID=A0ACC1QX07_9HYPO|nr:hypothetical protein NLG97_g4251 [Lecanicillium saksenae]
MLSFTPSILEGVIKSSNGGIWGLFWISCILPITFIYIRICSRRRRHVAHHPPKAELGLQVLHDCADAKVDIVAVHGLGANPDYAWVWLPKNNPANPHGYPDKPFNWLKDLLPDEMAKDEQPCRVLTYNYDSAWIADAPQQRLSNISDILLETLRNIRDKGHTKWRPLIFIGHSFGGNVIEQAIVSATRNGSEYLGIAESTVGVIFLGTPHRGSPAAAWGALIASLARPGFVTEDRLLKALEQHSDSLSDRLRDFSRWLFLESVSVVCAFEKLPTNYSSRVGFPGKFIPSNMLVVSELSACIDGHSGISLHSDHLKLNKFYGRDDLSFKLIYPQIEKMARGAEDTIHRRRNPQAVPMDESSTHGNLQKCLRAMRVANPVDVLAQIQEQNGERVGRTCEWILEKEEFTRWATIDAPQLLRLIGSPGIGKTMMSTFLVERIKTKIEKTSKSVFVYFFCDDKDQDRKTPTAILRSLMWQLLLQRNVLFRRHVQPDFEKHKDDRVFDDLFNKFHPLWRMFKAMLQDEQTGEVFILIDALDECKKTARQILLRSIASLVQSPSTPKFNRFKLLITCRHGIDDIEFELKHVGEQLRMDSAFVNDDLSEYIVAKVEKLAHSTTCPLQIKNKVQEVLTREAGGTFLWISLMVAELSRPGVLMCHWETKFQNLPHGLESTYASILENVSTENREPAQFILRCMVAAYRPLRKSEIQAAYATWKSRSLKRGEDLKIYSDILSSCSSILLVRGEGDATVNFCHQSVKDFLVQENSAKTPWYRSTLSEAHLRIFGACGVFLSADELVKRALFDRKLYAELSLHPFLEYAYEKWKHHAIASCAALLHSSHELLIDVAPAQEMRDAWLLCTAAQGQVTITDLLLKNGADINIKDGHGQTPLFQAAEYGREAIAELLLKNGANIDAKDHLGQTPLFRAAEYRREAIVELLLNNSAKVEVKDNSGNMPILIALRQENENMIKVLLEHGANGNCTDSDGRTPLVWASANGYVDIIQLLLEKDDIDVNAKDSYFDRTVLSLAAANGHLDIVKLLLERDDIDVNAKDSYFGQTALSLAAENGYLDIMATLLSQLGIEVDLKDTYYGRTPMSVAAENGHLDVVKLLLETEGVDANSTDTYFRRTPLWCAIQHGHPDVAELLAVNNGIEYNSGCKDALVPSCRDGMGISTEIIERGALTMEIVSYDGGIDTDDSDDEVSFYTGSYGTRCNMNDPNNILKQDSSVLCTKGERCHVVLRHQRSGVVFSLRELVIKAPSLREFSNPVREGLVYVSMALDNPFIEYRDGDDDQSTVRAHHADFGAAERPDHLQAPLTTTVRIIGGEMTAPIRFSVDRYKGWSEIRFDQAFPGRFIHLMMWSAPSERGGGTNVDIRSVIANGLVGPRYKPSAEFK